jgi:hypothetical protein
MQTVSSEHVFEAPVTVFRTLAAVVTLDTGLARRVVLVDLQQGELKLIIIRSILL